jgi:hypothetical protein
MMEMVFPCIMSRISGEKNYLVDQCAFCWHWKQEYFHSAAVLLKWRRTKNPRLELLLGDSSASHILTHLKHPFSGAILGHIVDSTFQWM